MSTQVGSVSGMANRMVTSWSAALALRSRCGANRGRCRPCWSRPARLPDRESHAVQPELEPVAPGVGVDFEEVDLGEIRHAELSAMPAVHVSGDAFRGMRNAFHCPTASLRTSLGPR